MTAWQEITGIELFPWEAKTLRKLSVAWVNERHRATQLNALAPYSLEPETQVDERVATQFKAMFAKFAA